MARPGSSAAGFSFPGGVPILFCGDGKGELTEYAHAHIFIAGETNSHTERDRPMRADYLIPEENIETFELLAAELSKRAVKLGSAPITVEKTFEKKTPFFATKLDRRLGIESFRSWFRVTIEGETPKLAGWTFLARIEHAETGNLIFALPGVSVPVEYRTAASACDHCGVNRMRNATYVVRHEDGSTRQVGSTCIADFLGHDDPHSVAKLAELLGAFDAEIVALGDEDSLGGGSRRPEAFALRGFLIGAATMIRVHGWTSRASARDYGLQSTSEAAIAYLDPWTRAEREEAARIGDPTDEDVAKADAAIEWVRTSFAGRDLSDFEHNVASIVAAGSVTRKTAGLAAAILPCHARALDKVAERAKTEKVDSQYIGEVGTRIDLEVEIAAAIPIESDFGFSTLVKMLDHQGNVLSTFYSGSKTIPAVGEKCVLRATVKKHEEYKGTRQTQVSRAVWK